MRRAYEILRDPTDRYLLWDLVDDAPVVAANRIVTFPAIAESRDFLQHLQCRAESRLYGAGDRQPSCAVVRSLPSRR